MIVYALEACLLSQEQKNEEQWWIPTSKRLPVAFLSFTKMNITSIFEINFKTIVSIKNQNKI
jgi:hypothetical protein